MGYFIDVFKDFFKDEDWTTMEDGDSDGSFFNMGGFDMGSMGGMGGGSSFSSWIARGQQQLGATQLLVAEISAGWWRSSCCSCSFVSESAGSVNSSDDAPASAKLAFGLDARGLGLGVGRAYQPESRGFEWLG